MTLAAYLGAHVALACAWLAFRAWLALVELSKDGFRIAWRTRVAVGRGLLVASLLAVPFAALLPRHRALQGATRIWALVVKEVSPAATKPGAVDLETGKRLALAKAEPTLAARAELFGGLALAGAATVEIVLFGLGIYRIRRLLRRGLALRRIGRVAVFAQADPAVPFALWTPRSALISLPQAMAAEPGALALALRHEGQHHRHGDPAWLWALALLAPLFPLNPFTRLWRKTFQDLHELACDEALLGRARLDPQAYGHCLVSVAEAALLARALPPGTAGMAADPCDPNRSKHLLSRRIAMFPRHLMLGESPRAAARAARRALAGAVLLVGCLGSLAYAAQGARPRPPLTLEETREIVRGIEVSADFPLAVNDAVLSRLNRAVTDPQRAAFVKASLERMELYRPLIEPELARLGFPKAILAVPLVESGYQNLPQQVVGAGIWQFIQRTARRYGLRVDAEVDERLDVEKETDAAMRLLGDDKRMFGGDWLLALAAYNQGEAHVQKAIRDGGARNAWELVEAGLLNDYIAYVTAGAILIHRPDLLE